MQAVIAAHYKVISDVKQQELVFLVHTSYHGSVGLGYLNYRVV